MLQGRLNKPWLVVFRGAPGTGKSTLSRALSRHLRWPVIDKDDVKDLLDGHTQAAGGLSYDIMFNIARRQLLLGVSVICDSPFAYPQQYRRAVAISTEADAKLVVIECYCSDERLWQRRVEARQTLQLPAHHTITWTAVRAFQERSGRSGPFDLTCPIVRIDSIHPVETSCAALVTWFQRQEAKRSVLPDASA